VQLAGLCDASDAKKWSTALGDHGFGKALDLGAMGKAGFFVCDKNLEDVLVTAVGTTQTLQIIDSQGEKVAFETFAKQPAQIGKPLHEQLCGYIHTRGRQIKYAPLLADALDLTKVPPPLEGVINAI